MVWLGCGCGGVVVVVLVGLVCVFVWFFFFFLFFFFLLVVFLVFVFLRAAGFDLVLTSHNFGDFGVFRGHLHSETRFQGPVQGLSIACLGSSLPGKTLRGFVLRRFLDPGPHHVAVPLSRDGDLFPGVHVE